MDTKISVIIPVYNAADYLKACVDSLQRQEFQDFELLLIDDGSTDGSGKLCDELAEIWKQVPAGNAETEHLQAGNSEKEHLQAGSSVKEHLPARSSEKEHLPVIRVFHTENQGAAAARNFGLAQAKGAYIAFIDSDDTVSEDYLSYLYRLVTQEGAQISVCGYRKVYAGKKTEQEDTAEKEDKVDICDKSDKDAMLVKTGIRKGNNSDAEKGVGKKTGTEKIRCYPGTQALEALLYQRDFMSVPWGMLSERKLWEKIQFPEGTKAEDMGTIYRLFALSSLTVYGPKICYAYFQRPGNTMFSTMPERNRDYFEHSREMVRFVKENFPALMPAARSRHFSACFQILSETPEDTDDRKLLGKIYADVRRLRKYVLRDRNARFMNRSAALLSLLSVRFLHFLLRIYYRLQREKLN